MKRVVLSNGQTVIARETRIKRSVPFIVVSVFMWLWALSLVFVLGWGMLVSFADGTYYSADMTAIFPKIWRLRNYIDAFVALKIGVTDFFGMTINSIWVASSFSVIRVFVTICASYVVARYKFVGRRLVYVFILVQMMIPTYGSSLANYKLLSDLYLVDSPLIIISMGAGHGMYFLILHSFFVNLPSDYEAAGRIDGASELTICFKLMVPMSKPIIVAMVIALWTGMWNDGAYALLYLPSYPTLASGLFRYRTVAAYTLDIPIYFAGILLSALPPTLIFIIFSDTVMSNLTIGGLKG